MLRDVVTVEEVVNSPMIADPLHRLDCCVISDGGGAIILAKPEIAKSCGQDPMSDAAQEKADEILNWFMLQLGPLRKILWTDIDAAYEGDPAATSYEEVIVAYPAVEAIAIQRMAHLLYERKVPLIPRLMTEWAHTRTGIDIHPGAKIGPHFFIDHGTGVVVGETCDIGARVKF